jgi:hypothetical protein
MNAVRFDTTVDEALADAAPALRPLLGRRVELIALDVDSTPTPIPRRRLSLGELLARRTVLAPGVGPFTDDDIDRAIAARASDGGP